MKVHYDEGVATHIGPEPCAGVREDVGEASAGERIGQPLSRESVDHPGCRRCSRHRKAIRSGALTRAPARPGVVEDPGMYGSSLHGNREISGSARALSASLVRIGKARSRSR